MSSPTSIKLTPPNYIDPKVRRPFMWMYLLQIWISILPIGLLVYWVFYPWFSSLLPWTLPEMPNALPNLIQQVWIYPKWVAVISIPLLLGGIYFLAVFWASCIVKLSLALLNRLHPPKEGVFFRSKDDKDYVFWNLRNLSRTYLFWLLYSSPFVLLKKFFTFTFFGIQIGKKSIIAQSWISPEFVSIGDNVIIGQSAAIFSYQIQGDKLLVATVQIGHNVRIGPQVIILPGTVIGNNAIVDGGAFTHPFSVLDENATYHGIPAKKISMD